MVGRDIAWLAISLFVFRYVRIVTISTIFEIILSGEGVSEIKASTMQIEKKLIIECLLFFFIFPCLLYFFRHQLAFHVFFLLITLTLICIIILLKDPEFNPKMLWPKLEVDHLKSIGIIFVPGAMVLTIVAYIALPARFFDFPFSQPAAWLNTMLVYPFFLVVPQEFLFRCFFFHRYRRLFTGKERYLMGLNALSFGMAHIFYGNWIAPVISFCGGLLFAWRYQASNTLFTVCLEHALWGNFLFTVGIGWYFYSGVIV